MQRLSLQTGHRCRVYQQEQQQHRSELPGPKGCPSLMNHRGTRLLPQPSRLAAVLICQLRHGKAAAAHTTWPWAPAPALITLQPTLPRWCCCTRLVGPTMTSGCSGRVALGLAALPCPHTSRLVCSFRLGCALVAVPTCCTTITGWCCCVGNWQQHT